MSTADTVVSIAKSQVGYKEGYSGGHWNNIEKYAGQVPGLAWANGQPWCAVFVSWVAMRAGVASLYPRTASVAAAASWWKNAGRWSEYPAIGAQVIYGGSAHTGVCVGYDATSIQVVEGNTNNDGSAEGNGVYLKTRLRNSTWITGYGVPKFPDGITSADPAYAKEAPVSLTRGANIDEAIAATRRAITANAGHPLKLTKLRTALAALLSIRPR
jgi:hypothetical protein